MFVGPDGHFKVVIDAFDGKTIAAWHVESVKGEKTANLATRSKGKHVDLVIGTACRSTGHFFSRVYPALFAEQQKALDEAAK